MKNCLIIVNTHKKESQEMGQFISEYLKRKKIDSTVFSFDGFSEAEKFDNSKDNPFLSADFVITLGGDGTVLFAARGCVERGIPVFPINFGEFGFIASIQKDEWKCELDSFLEGKANIVERNMLQAVVIDGKSGKDVYSGIGLNDIVISAKMASRTILMGVDFNYVSLGQFKADGIIVCTATGSTAYSSSAGGPIVDPTMDAIILTPKNSFSLSSRPLVLNPHGELEIKILPSRESDIIITLDGQKPFDIHEGDCIKIRQISKKVKLVGCTAERFYEALQSKLNWSGGPHA